MSFWKQSSGSDLGFIHSVARFSVGQVICLNPSFPRFIRQKAIPIAATAEPTENLRKDSKSEQFRDPDFSSSSLGGQVGGMLTKRKYLRIPITIDGSVENQSALLQGLLHLILLEDSIRQPLLLSIPMSLYNVLSRMRLLS